MAFKVTDLQVPASVADGPAVAVLPGDNWLDEGAALTAPGTVVSATPAAFVRASTTAFASGTPAGSLLSGN